MTIQDWGAIGELIGGVAVIVTLIYLALQIRQNTRAIKLSTVHGIAESFRSQYALVGQSDSVAELYTTGLLRPETLDQSQGVQFYALMHNMVRGYEDAYYQHAEGALDSKYWSGMQSQMCDSVSAQGFQNYWGDRKHWYSKSFQKHVNEVLLPGAKNGFKYGGSSVGVETQQ